MLQICKSDPKITAGFLAGLMDEDGAEVFFEILFDCTDKNTQNTFGRVIKYMLCQLKMHEKDLVASEEKETIEREEVDDKGTSVIKTEERPKSIALRFFNILIGHLDLRAPRAWNRFEAYLDIIAGFATQGPEEVLNEIAAGKVLPFEVGSEAFKLGIEHCFKAKLLTKFGDFMLQEDSPIHDAKNARPKMGAASVYSSASKPNFTNLLKVTMTMIAQEDML